MPDRYGNPRPGRDEPEPHDPDPEPDYASAAKRGLAAIRAQMGWTQPTTPEHPDSAASEPHSPRNKHPETTEPPQN